MMLPTGKWLKCPVCGHLYPEPDYSPSWHSRECEEKFKESQRKRGEQVRLKYRQEQYERCPDYQI